MSSYFLNNVYPNAEVRKSVGYIQMSLGNDKDSLATRVAYLLNFTGPCYTIQTYCSTSLVAVNTACSSLISRECDIALAGGVTVSVPQKEGYLYEEGGITSPDGHCRAFDADASGSPLGDGAGVVVLKRLDDALVDGDTIYAIIKGWAINNDGSLKSGYTAPSVMGQSNVITEALDCADVDVESISYIETHGTGTPLGDAVELGALIKVFADNTERKSFCALGSVKTNVGHLVCAAGVAGLIKTVQMLQHRQIPPSLHYTRPNPHIDLANSPFYVHTQLTEWKSSETPRRAGVSSFGIGGTNAHVVLEEAPEQKSDCSARNIYLLPFSAKTSTALNAVQNNLKKYIETHSDTDLADIAYTLQTGRKAFQYRHFCVARDHEEAIEVLAKIPSSTTLVQHERSIVYLLSGEEGLPLGGGKELYLQESVFREQMDHCCELLTPLLGQDLRTHLLTSSTTTESLLALPRYRLPATFALLYALTQLLKAWGVEPAALLGDRVGGMVAATLAGVLNLSDALALLVRYADMNLDEYTGSAFSDGQQTDIMRPWFRGITLSSPQLPCVSAVTGNWLTAEEISNPDYWLKQMRPSDCLQEGINTLLEMQAEMGEVLLLQIGAGRSVLPKQECMVHHLGPVEPGTSEMATLLTTLGRLWLAGARINWQGMYNQEPRRRVALPTYPFERQRYWIDPPARSLSCLQPRAAATSRKPEISEWFYIPEWKKAVLPQEPSPEFCAPSLFLLEKDNSAMQQLATCLEQKIAMPLLRVYAADTYQRHDNYTFSIRPDQRQDYELVFAELADQHLFPQHIIHSLNYSLDASPDIPSQVGDFQRAQQSGLYSLLALGQALTTHTGMYDVTVTVLANHMYTVAEQDYLLPEKTTVLGACKVMPQENPGLRTRCIDVSSVPEHLDSVIDELLCQQSSPEVAYRNGTRWVPQFRPLHIDKETLCELPLRQDGVYLITGGLGSIGLALAEHLAQHMPAHFVLIGRGALPQHQEWERWLAEHAEHDTTSIKLRALQRIERLGGNVHTLAVDVAQEDQMQELFAYIDTSFGRLDGVIYCAGNTASDAFHSLLTTDQALCERHFQTKAYGIMALEKALYARQLDFCVIFSSISSILGGLGFFSYAAANQFVDAFVAHHNSHSPQSWKCINWDTWSVHSVTASGVLAGTMVDYAMTIEEGMMAFDLALASPVLVLVNSTGDLQQRIQQWIARDMSSYISSLDEGLKSSKTYHPTQMGSVENLERKISEIWQQALGIEHINLHENFFDLGGNSLIGLHVMAQLRRELQVQLSPVTLFEAPTVHELARYLRNQQTETATSPAVVSPSTLSQRILPIQLCSSTLSLAERLLQRRQTRRQQVAGQEIAIVGMTGRFPGANTLEQFWQNLADGVESITLFSPEELQVAGVPPEQIQQPNYIRARPVLDDVTGFDAAFFGYSPQEAMVMDPQHRLFLESCWQALEMAGYDAPTFPGLIGVFGGNNISSYLFGFYNNPQVRQRINDYQIVIGNDKDFIDHKGLL